MPINVAYENWRQAGDPLSPPAGWTPSSPHASQANNTVAPPTTPSSILANPNNAWTNQPITPPAPTTPTSNYSGVSVVDYLKSVGQSSSYSNRIQLANQYGITNYSGTAAQNTQLLNMLRSGNKPTTNLNVPPATNPIDVTQTNQSRIEGVTGNTALDTFLKSTLNVGLSQTDQAIQTLLSQLETNRAAEETAAQKRQDDAALGLRNVQEGESLEDIQRRLVEEFELNDIRKQLGEYKNQLIALNEEASMADMAIKNKPINAAIIRGQRALKAEEMSYKAATIQAKVAIAGEQYDLAAQTVNSLFSAAAQDRADTISYYERLYELERQNLITLNQEERENINAQISLVQAADQRARDNQDKLASLFADPVMAKAFQQSGASLSDDFAVTMQKMLPFIVDENKRLELLAMAKKSGSGTGKPKFETDLQESAYDEALNMISIEQSQGSELTSEQYWDYVKSFAVANYGDKPTQSQLSNADSLLKSMMTTAKSNKGIPQGGIKEKNVWIPAFNNKKPYGKFSR